MYRQLKEIEFFEQKAQKVMSVLNDSINMNIDNLAKEVEIESEEINEIVQNLRKSQYIELGSYDHVHISKYGRKIQSGEINVGYGPI
ncbi:MAG: hypothetical protein GWN11_03495 [Candidatus Dadabacteria bacterium]|nr:hypothetical protein [Candidatus Dadabacteria bacterium]NIX14956.1 hypothetical protein [Candidatus Dadabacteria bacterium]